MLIEIISLSIVPCCSSTLQTKQPYEHPDRVRTCTPYPMLLRHNYRNTTYKRPSAFEIPPQTPNYAFKSYPQTNIPKQSS
jgi:hypothetical protein